MNLALFDFDGTITQDDRFTPFVKFSTNSIRLAWGALRLSREISAYRQGKLSASNMRTAIVQMAYGGRSLSVVDEYGLSYALQEIPKRIRKKSQERIEWHRERGDTVVVVSASLGAYLRPWCRKWELQLICNELDAVHGRLSGRYAGIDCSGAEKARRVREQYILEEYDEVYAYGDTIEDRELLALASRKFYRGREVTDFQSLVFDQGLENC